VADLRGGTESKRSLKISGADFDSMNQKIPQKGRLAFLGRADYLYSMLASSSKQSLSDNLNLQDYPPNCEERSYTAALEIPATEQYGEVLGTFLKAAGFVEIPEFNSKKRIFVPPLAEYVATSLKSAFDEAEAARITTQPKGRVAHREALRLLNSAEGKVPLGIAIPSPQAITGGLARKILESPNQDLDPVKDDISSWTRAGGQSRDKEEDFMSSIGPNSKRANESRGEMLISVDRQTGSLSFIPTGDAMGKEGPYSQKTKIYDPDRRKAELAVVYHRGLAVRANVARANPKALEKSLFSMMRDVIAEEVVAMTEEEFSSAFGDESLQKLAKVAEPRLAEAMRVLSREAREARKTVGIDEGGEGAAGRLVSAMDAFNKELLNPSQTERKNISRPEITHPLDLLLPAAGEYPWLFPSYVSKEVHRKGVMHFHGLSGRMFRTIFDKMNKSRDFVVHSSDDEDYNNTYRIPFEATIEEISEELDAEAALAARKAAQRVRTSIYAGMERGNVGFLDLIRGHGVVLGDGKPLKPVQAMSAMLGPVRDTLGGDEETLGEISNKIDTLSAKLMDGQEEVGIGSIRDFCSRVLKKTEISNELFGEQAVKSLRAARAAIIRAEKGAEEGKDSKCGAEKVALQSSVCDCLCFYFFGTATPQEEGKRRLVDRLVAAAANTEFVYFASQVGAEGVLKIGKAVDVGSRMSELSKDGHDVLPLAYVAVPGIPVGDWALSSVTAAVGAMRGEEKAKKATTSINRLVGLYGGTPTIGAAEFFVNAVNVALSRKAVQGGSGEAVGRGGLGDLTEDQVEKLLTESNLMRPATARSAHAIIRAISESIESAGGPVDKQKKIREASTRTLSLLAAELAWERIPNGGELEALEGFYQVEEATQMPSCNEAWPYRIQTGALVAEAALHQKYQKSHVYGEWFYLLAATDSIVRETEKAFSSKAVRCCAEGIGEVVSDLQKSGVRVSTSPELLPPSRDGYENAVKKVFAEEYGARVDKTKEGLGEKKYRLSRRGEVKERKSFD